MNGNARIPVRTLTSIRTALAGAGVEFVAEKGGGPGVWLRKPAPSG